MCTLSIPSFLRDDDLATGDMVDVRFGLEESDAVVFGFGVGVGWIDGVGEWVAFAFCHGEDVVWEGDASSRRMSSFSRGTNEVSIV